MADLNTKFESNSQEWETPQNLFDALNREFDFEFDLAANDKNKKCDKFYSRSNSALNKTWIGTCWINPPYGCKEAPLKDWIRKAYQETYKKECTVVMLIPSRTNTRWWHDYNMGCRGRENPRL